jgi:hypothetical protein
MLSRARRATTATFLPIGVAAALTAMGCDGEPPADEPAPAAAPPTATSVASVAKARPAAPASTTNPLGLPPRVVELGRKKRIFTFSDRMLESARIGSTLVLYAATALGVDGDDVVVEGRAGGAPYKVHGAYVIVVPDESRLVPGTPVVAEWNGALKHGVVTRLVKDKIGVRYTDMDAGTPEALLRGAHVFAQKEGLEPGSYAALRGDDGYRHVQLVSRFESSGAVRWLALGFGGAALVAEAERLAPIPARADPKPGAEVWAEYLGAMRKGTLTGVNGPGFAIVKFERAGKPVSVGWGLFMRPVQGD